MRNAHLSPRSGTGARAELVPSPPPSLSDKIRRFAWSLVQGTVYRWSPVPLHGWRRMLLRLFGAKVAAGAHPYPDAKVWAPWNLIMERQSCLGPRSICYSAGLVHLGENAVISQGAHLCAATHDHRHPDFTLMIAPIVIESHAWVAAEAFVGPGVTIGTRAVVGARSVAMKDVPPGKVVAGNPATCVAQCR
jgi:putative colanic acid biosynthesis acetyltransferase WcaF